MVVKFWDKTEKTVTNHIEAVQLIENSLLNLMSKEDKIDWYYSKMVKSSFPTIAAVSTKFGEATDHGAIIIENAGCY